MIRRGAAVLASYALGSLLGAALLALAAIGDVRLRRQRKGRR